MDRLTTPQVPAPKVETLDLINTEITARLARQFDSATSIDTKAVVLVGYAGVAATFLTTRHAQPVLATLAYVAFATAAGFGIWAYAVSYWTEVPNPRWIYDEYRVKSKIDVLDTLASTRAQVFGDNDAELRRKLARWWISLASLAVGMTLMIFSLTSAYW
jgi:hypothetical protein